MRATAVLVPLLLTLPACNALFDVGDVTGGQTSNPDRADATSSGGGDQIDAGEGGGDGTQSLTVTMTTTPVGGAYAPRNVVAVWVEDQAGTFQKTIGRWSQARTSSLVAWNQMSGGNDTDAVSGATRPSHDAPITATWDLAGLADGTYNVRVEIADDNSTTPDQNHQATFPFELNGTASTQELNGQGLTAITIDYSGRQ
jgi:hypothetical protein